MMHMPSPVSVANIPSSKPSSMLPYNPVSLGKWRSSSVDGCRRELLVNAYSNKLREGLGAAHRSSSWHGPVDCPTDVASICDMEEGRSKVFYDKGERQHFEPTFQYDSHHESLPRKLKMRQSLPISIGSTRIAASSKQHPYALRRDDAAIAIQRAYRAHRAFEKLRLTNARVGLTIIRTQHSSPSVRIEQLHALIEELGAISAILDNSSLTANNPRVASAAREAATSVRLALEDAEASSAESSSVSDNSHESLETPASSELDDEEVWVYTPRSANVMSCLDFNASDVFSTEGEDGLTKEMHASDISDSDSDFEQLISAQANSSSALLKERELSELSFPPELDTDNGLDDIIEELHEESPQSPLSPIPSSPSFLDVSTRSAQSQTGRSNIMTFPPPRTLSPAAILAETRAKAYLANLAAFFSGDNPRWAGQPKEAFPPPKRSRYRSVCSLPPPRHLYVIVE